MDKVLNARAGYIQPVRSFILPRPRCRPRRGLLKVLAAYFTLGSCLRNEVSKPVTYDKDKYFMKCAILRIDYRRLVIIMRSVYLFSKLGFDAVFFSMIRELNTKQFHDIL